MAFRVLTSYYSTTLLTVFSLALYLAFVSFLFSTTFLLSTSISSWSAFRMSLIFSDDFYLRYRKFWSSLSIYLWFLFSSFISGSFLMMGGCLFAAAALSSEVVSLLAPSFFSSLWGAWRVISSILRHILHFIWLFCRPSGEGNISLSSFFKIPIRILKNHQTLWMIWYTYLHLPSSELPVQLHQHPDHCASSFHCESRKCHSWAAPWPPVATALRHSTWSRNERYLDRFRSG